jgi:hypothetical protein
MTYFQKVTEVKMYFILENLKLKIYHESETNAQIGTSLKMCSKYIWFSGLTISFGVIQLLASFPQPPCPISCSQTFNWEKGTKHQSNI